MPIVLSSHITAFAQPLLAVASACVRKGYGYWYWFRCGASGGPVTMT